MTEPEARNELERLFNERMRKQERREFIEIHMRAIRSEAKGYWSPPIAKRYIQELKNRL